MKKLTKKQKNALLVGGGALAILALSSFGKNPHENPDFKILGIDENNGIVDYVVNGQMRRVSAKGISFYPLPNQGRNPVYGIYTQSTPDCIMQFLLRKNGVFVKELARLQLPQQACERQIIIGGAASETL